MSEAIIFSHMKEEIDALIAQYGQEDPPPPWGTFTIPNDIKEGNMHVVQKVFEGSFEVSWCFGSLLPYLLTSCPVRHHILVSVC